MQDVTNLFYLPTIQLMVYKRTVKRSIADKVVYQGVRWTTWLASDNSWGRRRLKHMSSRVLWIFLYKLEESVPCEISQADWCLLGLSSWLSTRSSTAPCRTWSATAWLKSNCSHRANSLQQTIDASKFPLVRKITKQPSCTTPPWQTDFKKSESHLPNFIILIVIAREHTDVRYWYSNSVCPSVCP